MTRENVKDLIEELMTLMPNYRKNFSQPTRVLRNFNISHTQHICLIILAEKGPISMSDLAAELYVSNQRLTKIVDSLVAYGFAERKEDKTNRRVILAEITEKGQMQLEHFKSCFFEQLYNNFDKLSDEDIKVFIKDIKEINAILNKVKISDKVL